LVFLDEVFEGVGCVVLDFDCVVVCFWIECGLIGDYDEVLWVCWWCVGFELWELVVGCVVDDYFGGYF